MTVQTEEDYDDEEFFECQDYFDNDILEILGLDSKMNIGEEL